MHKSWFISISVVAGLLFSVALWMRPAEKTPIRIGVLYSQTGVMATSEHALIDAVQLAVEEINAQGGLLGRPVEMVIADGRSDNTVVADEAERLIVQEKVSMLLACWTSSCRKAVIPVVERNQHLMLYSVQYEGLEQSQHVFYLGEVPNQQLVPGTHWAIERFGKRVYIVGSRYVYPRLAGRIIRDVAEANGATVLADRHQPLDKTDFSEVVEELRKLKPDVVFNNINGDTNQAFFRALQEAGLSKLPIVSFSVAEDQAYQIGQAAFHPHHYAVWSYFQSMPGKENQRFVAAFQSRIGREHPTSAPVEATYTGVKLWAQAVRAAGTDHPSDVSVVLPHQTLAGPSGIISFDRESRHLWKTPMVGRARPDGQFEIVWNYGDQMRPRVFPVYRPIHEWLRLVQDARGP